MIWLDDTLGPTSKASAAIVVIWIWKRAHEDVSKDSTPSSAFGPHTVLGFTALQEEQGMRKGDRVWGTQALCLLVSTKWMLSQS